MNLNTIAKLAEVSVSTVSKAFAGSGEISSDTREKIFEIARENGCFEKYYKNKYEKKVIAVIYPEIRSEYYAAVLDVLDSVITQNGGIMTAASYNFTPKRKLELFQYYSAYAKVDGIILIGTGRGIKNPLKVPLVFLLCNIKSIHGDTIACDMQSSIDRAIACLKEKGHVRIGFAGDFLTRGKLEGFRKAMESAGLQVHPGDTKISEKRFEEAGIEMMDEWLAEKEPPTAILAAYDYVAIGLAKSIRRHGYRIPEDFSIIGMDDISVVPYMDTAISSIRTNKEEACRIAVDLILKKINNKYFTSRQDITVQTELVLRESVGECRRGFADKSYTGGDR